MKIICLQENLKKALSITEKIIGRNLTLPVLNNILFSIEKNKIKIASTNLEIGINCWINGKIEKEGSITIPAKLFSNLVNNLPNKKIELTVKNNKLTVNADEFSASINTISADEFPIIPKINDTVLCVINGNLLKNSLSQVVEMASLSESRPEISGIFMEFNKNSIKLVATDSFRLAEKNIPTNFLPASRLGGSENDINNKSIIIPQRTVQELIRILGEIDNEVKVILSGNQILFDLNEVQIISRLIEGQYPDYKQIIPGNFKTQITINKNELIKSIKTASLFSGKINDVKLVINPSKLLLEISAKNTDIGENNSQIISKVEGDPLDISFNYKYLLDGLNNILSDKVIIEFNNSASPAVIKPVGDMSYIYVIMPIKL